MLVLPLTACASLGETAELRVHSSLRVWNFVPYAQNLSNVFDPELEHVSFTFDTINLDSMIVCGRPASPHDLVHESDARRGLLRVLR